MDLSSPQRGDLDVSEYSGASAGFMSSLWAEAGTELLEGVKSLPRVPTFKVPCERAKSQPFYQKTNIISIAVGKHGFCERWPCPPWQLRVLSTPTAGIHG